MYIDNIVIWAIAKNNTKLFNILHKDMNAAPTDLTEWSDNNNMKINVQTTNHQLFSLKQTLREHTSSSKDT